MTFQQRIERAIEKSGGRLNLDPLEPWEPPTLYMTAEETAVARQEIARQRAAIDTEK